MSDGPPSRLPSGLYPPAGRPAQVWLVEDNPLEAQRTCTLLAGRYEVTHFSEAASMLERLGNHGPPELLLLDWQLPGLSGLEACHFVREQYDEVELPVLMLTVRGAREDMREGLAAGCNDYVAKPYDDATLLARMRTLVRARRAVADARSAQSLSESALQEVQEAHAQLEESHTQLQAARIELDLERERLAAIFEHAPAIVAMARGPEHVFAMVNPLYQRVIGGGRTLLGRPVREALPEVVAQGFVRLLDEVYRTGEPYVGRELPLRVDREGNGHYEDTFFTVVYQPIRDAQGRVDGIAAFGFEVTQQVQARLQAEQLAQSLAAERAQLLAVLDNAPLAVIIVDARGKLLLANKRSERELRQATPRVESAEDLRQWGGLDAERRPLPLEEYALMRGLRGLSAAGEEFHFRFPDGTEGTLEVAYGPVRDPAGNIIASVVIFSDITGRKRGEEALRESAGFERQLIGIVSHDLRNPLAAIGMSAATLLRRPDLDERHRPPVARILSSAERATRMIRDLLDFTQARLGGGLVLNRGGVDLHALARQALDEQLLTHPEREVHLRLQGEPRGTWDADRLQQLLGNLLGNALAYSPAGTPVRLEVQGEPGQDVLIEVHNDGEPIDPALLRRLFHPFERGENQVNRAGRSIGLGLFIVQSIARAHGGSVEVQSTAQEGTLFRVRLPRGAPQA